MSHLDRMLTIFTKPVIATCLEYTLNLYIIPDQDLDYRFKAYDRDSGEMIVIDGWLFEFEDN